MKYALINPDVKEYRYDGTILGDAIVSTDVRQFEVCPPLFWVECEDNVEQRAYYWNETDKAIEPIPAPPTPVESDSTTTIPPPPTVADLQAQLATIQTQLAALTKP